MPDLFVNAENIEGPCSKDTDDSAEDVLLLNVNVYQTIGFLFYVVDGLPDMSDFQTRREWNRRVKPVGMRIRGHGVRGLQTAR